MTTGDPANRIWTVGHSNRSLDEFVQLLSAHSIELLADVRRYPGSRRHPQFGSDALEAGLRSAEIDYRHLPGLGGRRTQRLPDSPNTAWRVESFNAYADHMQTPEFQAALGELISLATSRATAIMCAEALPWQCHRRLIADTLLARGWTVLDIFSETQARPHQLPDFALIRDTTVIYPSATLF